MIQLMASPDGNSPDSKWQVGKFYKVRYHLGDYFENKKFIPDGHASHRFRDGAEGFYDTSGQYARPLSPRDGNMRAENPSALEIYQRLLPVILDRNRTRVDRNRN